MFGCEHGRMKDLRSKDFRAAPGQRVKLNSRPTRIQPLFRSKVHYEMLLRKDKEELDSLQSRLFAHDRYSVLVIFQAMDAAGKDGAIKHVMSGVNPQGCQVFSFKHPSIEELEHDFLWRTTRSLPERGRIGIFNRSYYEEVLIVRVHPEILSSQRLPEESLERKTVWEDRYQSIVDLENHLHRNGTRIIKFFLHISKEEQKKRLLKRIDDPEKNWKVAAGDVTERALWNEYMKAYEDCLAATSTRRSPWYIIPADDKKTARLIVSSVILDTMRSLEMPFPKPDAERKKELQAIRKALMDS
jgi:PPK2 family polyphosphate:nucleotide phosphotransferase